jgi:hypothetical protein
MSESASSTRYLETVVEPLRDAELITLVAHDGAVSLLLGIRGRPEQAGSFSLVRRKALDSAGFPDTGTK